MTAISRNARCRTGGAATALLCAAGLALLASACGGSPGVAVAQIATSTTSTTTASSSSTGSKSGDAAAYATCMRKHGVTNFPDPDSQGRIKITGGSKNGRSFGMDPNAPNFKTAQKACGHLLPNGGRPTAQQQAAMQATMLKFSACMRSHGVPKFPDPTFGPNGGGMMKIGKSAGLDPNSPQFQAAQKACQKLVPGGPMTQGGPGQKP
jgi:hypothetical protein